MLEKISYIDNSVISEMRLKTSLRNLSFDKDRVVNTLKANNISPKYSIITDKLFLEIIYLGNIRKKIVNDNINEELIKRKKNTFVRSDFSQKDIQDYTNFLESFFEQRLIEALPQLSILNLTESNLQEKPFIVDEFKIFEEKIINYAQSLRDDNDEYYAFIKNLVIDSVIRYMTLELAKDIAPDNLIKIISSLFIKYPNDTNLMLLMASLKANVEREKKIKGRPNLFRLNDDFADSEMQEFAFCGHQGYPVSVLTFEKMHTVKERLRFYLAAMIKVTQFKNANKIGPWKEFFVINEFGKAESIPLKELLDSVITPDSYTLQI